MKIKTSKLTGAALDWAVAKCENVEPDENNKPIWFGDGDERVDYTPSTDWAQGGPIIERVRIDITFMDGDEVDAWHVSGAHGRDQLPLIAAMRCYVASKLGDDVDVPKELT